MPFYFTPTGHRKLLKLVETLEHNVKGIQGESAHIAESGGDSWHDNPSYHTMVINLRGADARLSEMQAIKNQAQVIKIPDKPEKVMLGTMVTLTINDEECRYGIVSHGQSNPEKDMVAYDTPFAKFILLMRAGQTKEGQITAGEKKSKVTITRIEALTPEMEGEM